MQVDNVKHNIEKDVEEILMDKNNIEELRKKFDFNNTYIVCCLINTKQLNDSFAICIDEKMEDALLIKPYSKNKLDKFQLVDYYNFNYNDYFFRYLENGYEIEKIDMVANYAIWLQVSERYPHDITFKNGMQKYLKYCKENNITKNSISKACHTKGICNIMKYYKLEKKKEKRDR